MAMKKIFGEPKREFYATKMQSHSTYFMWKPNTKLMAFLKLQGREGDTTTHDMTVKSAIATNTALEFLSRQTHDQSDISFFPERFGASLNLKGNVSYSYSMRALRPTDWSKLPSTIRIYPAHGFFASERLKTILEEKNISLEEWIEKYYAPKLGEFIAITNFRYGIYTEAHTQNLLIKITSAGEIQGFSFRDLADVAIDAMVSLRSPSLSKLLSLYEGNKMLSRLGRNHVSDNGKAGAFRHLGAGWINGGYFVMEPEFFDLIQDDKTILERGPLERLAQSGELMAFQHQGFWHCMDTKRDLDNLEEFWNSGKAPWKK